MSTGYILAAEFTVQHMPFTEGIDTHRQYCSPETDPSAPCCRCVNGRRVCSDAHCPRLLCPEEEQLYSNGQCCPLCQNHKHHM